MCADTYTLTHSQTQTHTHRFSYTNTHTHIHRHNNTYSERHTHAHTFRHTHTHTHTLTQKFRCAFWQDLKFIDCISYSGETHKKAYSRHETKLHLVLRHHFCCSMKSGITSQMTILAALLLPGVILSLGTHSWKK